MSQHTLTEEEWKEYQALKGQSGTVSSQEETDVCMKGFIDMLKYMLDAVSFVFPECGKTTQAIDDLRIACNSSLAKKKIIARWHQTMHPYYMAVSKRDDSALRAANIDWFQKLDILTKWDDPGFTQESKDNMWSCLEQLNKYAGMYNSMNNIPQSMMSNIHNTAFEVFKSIQEGGQTLDDLDLMELGEKVVANSSKADLREFTASIPQITQNFGGFENIMQMIQGGVPGLAKQMGFDPKSM